MWVPARPDETPALSEHLWSSMRTETLLPPLARRGGIRPHEVDDRELFALIERKQGPIVLESYYEGWEHPWRALSTEDWRTLSCEPLSNEKCECIHTAVVETQKSRATAVRFGLEVIPTVLVFLGGEVVARFTGRVLIQDVVDAVRAARQRAWTLEASALELEAAEAAHETPSPRLFWRRRSSEHPLANVG